MRAKEVETRIIFINERVLTTSVNDIEHIESQSLDGVGVIRIYFQPGPFAVVCAPSRRIGIGRVRLITPEYVWGRYELIGSRCQRPSVDDAASEVSMPTQSRGHGTRLFLLTLDTDV